MRIIRDIKLLCMTVLLSGCHSATIDMEQFVEVSDKTNAKQ